MMKIATGQVTAMLISTRPTSELVSPICLKITYCGIIATWAGTASPSANSPKMAMPSQPWMRAMANAASEEMNSVRPPRTG